MPRVSIVIASFNEYELLPRLLRSIACQSFTDTETIVVEGSANPVMQTIANGHGARFIRDTKRNIGFARNLGVSYAQAPLLFITNGDCTFMDRNLLKKVFGIFQRNDIVVCTGRTVEECDSPLTKVIYLTYQVTLKFLCNLPRPLTKFRSTANFLVIRKDVFERLGGFPELRVNEDGAFGYKIDLYLAKTGAKAVNDWGLRILHRTRRFQHGGIRWAMRYYLYVLPNFFSMLRKPLVSITREAERVFLERKFRGEQGKYAISNKYGDSEVQA